MRRSSTWLSLLTAGALTIGIHAQASADPLKPGDTAIEVTRYVGGPGGGFTSLLCPRETPILVGISGRFGSWIDAIAPLCISINEYGRWRGQQPIEPANSRVGGSGGSENSYACAAGTFVLGMTAYQSEADDDYVVAIELHCGRPETGVVQGIQTDYDIAGGAEFQSHIIITADPMMCTGGRVGAGINTYSGDYLDRIALVCSPLPSQRVAGVETGIDLGQEFTPLKIKRRPAVQYQTGTFGIEPGQQVTVAPQKLNRDLAARYQSGMATGTEVPPTTVPMLPASQTYKPPLTKSGARLYACLTLDDDVCKQPVADAFCQQQGFARAGKFDTDKHKVAADTLAGQHCTSKKCRVFDFIVCTR